MDRVLPILTEIHLFIGAGQSLYEISIKNKQLMNLLLIISA